MSAARTTKGTHRLPRSTLGMETNEAPASTELRTTEFEFAGDDYVVLSYPHAAAAPPPALTSTEQAIFTALLDGQSNHKIAARRGRALRTVANQVAAIFQKLGVGSRAELAAKFSGLR